MKKMILLAVAAMLMLVMSACGADVLEKSPYDAQTADLRMTIKPDIVAADAQTLGIVIESLSENEYITGVDFGIEMQRDGTWYTYAPKEDLEWIDIALIIEPGGVYEDEITLYSFYGKLKPGTYRVVKTFYQIDKDSSVAFGQFIVE